MTSWRSLDEKYGMSRPASRTPRRMYSFRGVTLLHENVTMGRPAPPPIRSPALAMTFVPSRRGWFSSW